MTRLKRKKTLPSTHKNDVRFGTPQIVAEYRAERLCQDADTIVEVGAGAGFQTAAFTLYCDNVIAVDIDAERLARGKFSHYVHVIAGDALSDAVFANIQKHCKGKTVVFLDPERPSSSKMRTLSEIQPDLNAFVQKYAALGPIAMELPPFLEDIPWECEREYLSIDGELNRLTVYLGALKKDDVSVIRLPEWKRVGHSGAIAKNKPVRVNPKYVLLPDKALEQAGLTETLFPGKYDVLPMGKKRAFMTETLVSSMFKTYTVIAHGTREEVVPHLRHVSSVILHGEISQKEQRALLDELNPLCVGKERAHLFLGKQWVLAR